MAKGKQVYAFHEGSAKMKALLGGKGANLAEMTRAGLPVPPGFTITTEACLSYFEQGGSLSEALKQETADALKKLELVKSQQFGSPTAPLLVSVRSGSVASMPGMMDTILNLGLNDETVMGLAALTGNPRFAYDCYRRLIAMFGNVVLGIEGHHFEQRLNKLKNSLGVRLDQDVPDYGWQRLVGEFKAICASRSERAFPQDVHEQLHMAIEAVFGSWNNSRAQIYRRINRIPDDQGTAVNIQSMAFGNRGTDSGTGVIFTRNPSTGEARLYGEYLMNAQGEDVVAGVRTPLSISAMEGEQPGLYAQLASVAQQLERHYRDMQDIEFTVETGKLYLLQTRNGKRNAKAALRIAVEFVREGLLTRNEALERIEPSHLDQLLHRGLDEQAVQAVLAVGLPASLGAAAGQLTFDADTAAQWHREGLPVILARPETTPEDIHGVLASEGVLTSRGGMTSHAAVVARGMGKPCVCGCESLRIDAKGGTMEASGIVVREGDWITLDGASGRVIVGNVPLREPETSAELLEILGWADEVRKLRVMTNADNPHDARVARAFGAEGIGLCRTEHMFFAPDRLPVMQAMILAETDAARRSALELLLPMQQSDFEGMFREMDGLPVTIRLLDPPLHEFLPSAADLQQRLAGAASGQSAGERRELTALLRKVNALHESNPMLGQRGCRLGIVFPEIYDMQIEAIFRAVAECLEDGVAVLPEIMIPLVGHVNELSFLRGRIDGMAAQLLGEEKLKACRYKVGTMIEVPRAALTARQIAAHADFFSFGTNDLTQMTFGYSRDDAEGKFLSHYVDQKLLPENPFQVLDTEGVGQLIELASAAGRAVNPRLKTGVCGEHGGDKSSIFFCHQAGLDYVSCSPYRVPLARIAAAQAAIAFGNEGADGLKLEA
ncbi:pyruvate, phosphate dikinase [Paenibacillus sacheonensis]|uniref:Pyruvate, phosphate dikinase n=1 Tax=Paenibacillus sacheonensis TaxID=742054 RepID=A0A7X5C005_9BACL|nr:pyruvate, phosphate dikinase [Paenibacillus sacheonensis]MBM7563634.1 pyruvate,orthophosphate dikinase [Paenibacillus sacheonensis]NBC71071.1 pyruvate, phosphate dikinase [Paenibacillus sacheonensis]